MNKSVVSVVKCPTYNYEDVENSVEEVVSYIGGFDKFIKPKDKVLLKPNLVAPLSPETATTTHFSIVSSIAKMIQKLGAIVMIGDGSGIEVREGKLSAVDELKKTEKTFEISGIKKIAIENNLILRNFQEEKFITKKIHDYKVLEKVEFAKAIFDSDVIVNLPKLKTYGGTLLTLAVKNCFGCVKNTTRFKLHHEIAKTRIDLAEGIVDVYSVVKPQLNIMDAIVGMEGHGPTSGDPKKIGLILASTDAVALDVISSEIVNVNPKAILTTTCAEKRGLGNGSSKNIKVIGKKIKNLIVRDFKLPNFIDSLGNTFVRANNETNYRFFPFFNNHCTMCGKCMNYCPTKAIQKHKKLETNIKKCISCFLCEEVCESECVSRRKIFINCKENDKMTVNKCLDCIYRLRGFCDGIVK